MRSLRTLLAITFLGICSLPAGAGTIDSVCTGFAGKWKLDFAKSHIGKEKEVPKEVTAEITYSKPELRVRLSKALSAGTSVTDFRYFTNGTVSMNVAEGLRWKSVSVRESGRDLLLEQNAKYLVFTIDVSDRWTLSPDGRQLTIDRAINSAPRNEKILYVFQRQA